jgi:Histidine kinase-, DNA gyrase B-, and HSP90-like ATPase./Histidine kinase.
MFLRMCITGMMIIECAKQSNSDIWVQLAYISGIILLSFNELLRHYWTKFQEDRIYWISISVNIIGAGFYAFLLNSLPASIYYLFPLVELIIDCGKVWYPLVILHIGVFITANYLLDDLTLRNLVIYSSIFMVIYLYRRNLDEKREIAVLNQKLICANQQLMEYADNIEKTAQIKERTRIAQEIHDSIGHGLVALSMHLEFIQMMMDQDQEKASISIQKAHTLSLKCLQDLRSAVSILKEDRTKNNLENSIQEMIDNINQSEAKIVLTFDNQAEKVSLNIKDCIYKTIREAITNSFKNGNANEIQIKVAYKEHLVLVTVQDNGIGCNYIIKSNGLSAIEERAEKLGGMVDYEAWQGHGFLLRMQIPVES